MARKHLAPYDHPLAALKYCAAFVRPVGLGIGVHVRRLGRFRTAFEAQAFAEKIRRPNEDVRSVFIQKMAATVLVGIETNLIEQLKWASQRANKPFSTTSDQPIQPRWIGPCTDLMRRAG